MTMKEWRTATDGRLDRIEAALFPDPPPPPTINQFGLYPGFLQNGATEALAARRTRARTTFGLGQLPVERIFHYGSNPDMWVDVFGPAAIVSWDPSIDWTLGSAGYNAIKSWLQRQKNLNPEVMIWATTWHEPDQAHRCPGYRFAPQEHLLQELVKSINPNWMVGPILMQWSAAYPATPNDSASQLARVAEWIDPAWDGIGWDMYYRHWQLPAYGTAKPMWDVILRINAGRPMVIGELGIGGPGRPTSSIDGLTEDQRTAFVVDSIATIKDPVNNIRYAAWFNTNKPDIDSVLEPHDNPSTEGGHVEHPGSFDAWREAMQH